MEFWNFASSNLKKNGEIVLSTPNGNLIPKNEWYSELPPIHYSLFKEKTFKILRKKNYRVKFYNKYQFSYNIFFIRKMFQFKLSNLRTSFFKRKLRNNFILVQIPHKNFIIL